MSYKTIALAVIDDSLIKRVRAAVAKEAFGNETLKASVTGQRVIREGPDTFTNRFLWAVSIANEAAYEYAVGAGNTDPGGDLGVINDEAIGAAIQANWPTDALINPPTYYLQVVGVNEIPSPA